MAMFQKSVLNRHLTSLNPEKVKKAYRKFQENYNSRKIEEIKTLKEEVYQDGFLRDIFVDVLGFTLQPEDNYNLQREFKNIGDSKKADGAIIKDGNALAVIELKSTKTKDLTKVTEQAFNYKNNQPECKYVITSNFRKLHFYIDYAHEFEEFDLFNLKESDFKLFYLLLSKDNLTSNLPQKIKKETEFHEQAISNKLYKDYSSFKSKLFRNLIKNQPDHDQIKLYKNSQKLLDRFLFILFAEDSGLLPPNSISRIIKRFQILKEEDAYKPLYEIYVQYFNYMNTGKKGKKPSDDIPAYNGGLFYPDIGLDELLIDDEILIDDLLNLSKYDFNTEVDVNVLGHIFEHSLNEIEEITAQLEGRVSDKKKSKRNKDGVFYTPKYVTQYIVENTIGALCKSKRKELNIEEIEFDGTYKTVKGGLKKAGKELFITLNDYKDWLFNLKILDPACGSGAFLNQALKFLISEHKHIDDILEELTGHSLPIFDTDKSILENNLFGVDINDESVEIAQLSLWLRTAKKDRKLSSLNNNIKCGNSLIDDPVVAGDKAFDWNLEFKEIMNNGGFDVVIGNPPYVKRQNLSDERQIHFLEKSYQSATYNFDLYLLFIEKASQLINKHGLVSYICPSKFTSTKTGEGLRNYLDSRCHITKFIDFKDFQVFADAITYCCIFVLNNNTKAKTDYYELNENQPKKISSFAKYEILISKTASGIGWQFKPSINISGQRSLKDFVETFTGIESGADNLYVIDKNEPIIELFKHSFGEIVFPTIKGINVHRFFIDNDPYCAIVPYSKKNKLLDSESIKRNHPNVWNYLIEHKEVLKARGKGKMNTSKWYGYVYPKNLHKYSNCRLVWTDISIKPQFVIDDSQSWHVRTVCSLEINNEGASIGLNLKVLLGILNSSLFYYYIKTNSNTVRGGYLRYKPQYVKEFPLPDVINRELCKHLEKSVNEITEKTKQFYSIKNNFITYLKVQLKLKKMNKNFQNWFDLDFAGFLKELNSAFKKNLDTKLSKEEEMEWINLFKNNKDKILNEMNGISKLDRQIDKIVYQLYGLSPGEIELVEKSLN
jgi:type I restriction-modification system DNA methylase subunit